MNRQLVLALIEKICEAKKQQVLYGHHHAEQTKSRGIENCLELKKRIMGKRLPYSEQSK